MLSLYIQIMKCHSYEHLIRIIGKKRQNILLYQSCNNTELNFEKYPRMYNHDQLVTMV